MFSGKPLLRENNITKNSVSLLKLPEFYSLPLDQKRVQWEKIQNCSVVSCHRQNGFDFNIIEPTPVISLQVNDRTWLHNRVKKIHLQQSGYEFGNSFLRSIKKNLPKEYIDLMIESDYKTWATANILPSDDILDFELLLDDSIHAWCDSRGLTVDPVPLSLIREEVDKYR